MAISLKSRRSGLDLPGLGVWSSARLEILAASIKACRARRGRKPLVANAPNMPESSRRGGASAPSEA
jgi:hypothetical protein